MPVLTDGNFMPARATFTPCEKGFMSATTVVPVRPVCRTVVAVLPSVTTPLSVTASDCRVRWSGAACRLCTASAGEKRKIYAIRKMITCGA